MSLKYLCQKMCFPIISRFSVGKNIVDFLTNAWTMRRFVKGAVNGTEDPSGISVAVIVTPWYGSSAPWFSIAAGLMLAARNHKVTFILDDVAVGPKDKWWIIQLKLLKVFLRTLRHQYSILRLSDNCCNSSINSETRVEVDRLAYLNAVWFGKGESLVKPDVVKRLSKQLDEAHRAVENLLRQIKFHLLLVPGGICGTSGIWLSNGRKFGVRVSTYDSAGYGVMLLAADGIACQLHDIPKAFMMLNADVRTPKEREGTFQYAIDEISRRRSGKDRFVSQIDCAGPKRPEYNNGIIIALNSPWDSAALGLHTVFNSTQDWIVKTVDYLLKRHQVPIIVRQHPVERLPSARSSDDILALLKANFGNNSRLHFIAADDLINSYDLLDQVTGVVVYTSTIGIESAVRGKPVLTESCCYYSDLGFVFKATTPEMYFDQLDKIISGCCIVSDRMQEDALMCYYITQCCNWFETDFTVQNCSNWSRQDFATLNSENSVNMLIESIVTNTPLSIFNHQRRMGLGNLPNATRLAK